MAHYINTILKHALWQAQGTHLFTSPNQDKSSSSGSLSSTTHCALPAASASAPGWGRSGAVTSLFSGRALKLLAPDCALANSWLRRGAFRGLCIPAA
jgi:hypothetical protein